MRIILDTNVYVADFWMRGADFQTLLSALSTTGHSLAVPAIVVEEVCRKYREQLEACYIEFEKTQNKLERLVPALRRQPLQQKEKVASTFDKDFRARLSHAKARLLRYPDTSHQKLVRRALEKRRPFDDRGAGYRDALIWDSVLSLARRPGDDVALITQDIADFLHKNGDDVELHADLQAEAECVLGRDNRVRAFHTLGAFINREVQPRLQELNSAKASLQERGVLGKLDLGRALLLSLKPEMEQRFVDPAWLGFPETTEYVAIAEVERVAHIEVRDARRLSDTKVLLELSADTEVRFAHVYAQYVPSGPSLMDDLTDRDAAPVALDDSEEGAFVIDVRAIFDQHQAKLTSVQIKGVRPAS